MRRNIDDFKTSQDKSTKMGKQKEYDCSLDIHKNRNEQILKEKQELEKELTLRKQENHDQEKDFQSSLDRLQIDLKSSKGEVG